MPGKEKLNLPELFLYMPDYVIMRIPDKFPDYDFNTDVDILCLDMGKCMEHLCKQIPFVIKQVNRNQVHLDYFTEGKLNIKLDLYEEYISKEFKDDVLRTKRFNTIKKVWVLWEKYNLASKYYEYRVNWKEKYQRFEQYKYILDEYYPL